MKTYMKLSSFLSEYTERNTENKYRPVAVGRYGIRTRESIYSKELAKDYSKNKVIGKNTLTVGMGSVQIDIGILTDDVKYSVSPAYHTYTITGINPDYLRYCLECRNQDMFERYVKRGSRQGKTIDLGRWLTYEIPVGSEINQQEIVSQLDFVESLITARREQLEKLDELVKSRFIELFGDVIQNNRGWEQYTFSDIATSRLGKMLDAKQQTGKCAYPYLANFNVQWFRFEIDNLNKMDFNEADRQEFELRDGDLLVCEGGEIGRCAVWHNEIQPCYFQKALHRVQCNQHIILPDYMAWWFKYNCDHKGFAAIEGAKATIAHLPGAKLKALKVTVPPIELQNQFVAFLKQTDKSKLAIHESLAELETLKKALMQKYFG